MINKKSDKSNMFKTYETELAGRELTIETGKIAGLSKWKCSSKIWRHCCNGKCYSIKRTKRRNRLFPTISRL